ncbi:hypothetical protein C8R48DRAFT_782359 [Suillus tomentosus]|nr:hypothetical protein C8R48DRAFT_782359 [Suillus tomentosus]
MPYRLPIRGTANAPKFDGTTDNLAEFIDTYEQLADEAGLQGLDRIKGIIRYLARDDRELWGGMPEAAVDDYDAFLDEVKVMYPGWDGKRRYALTDLRAIAREYANKPMPSCTELSNYLRAFRKIMQPLMDEDRIGKVERDHLFMEGIPSDAQAQIRLRLMIKFPDHHPYDPYPFMDVFAAAQFLLSGRAFPAPSAPVSAPVSAPIVAPIATLVTATAPVQTKVAKYKDQYHASRATQDTTISANATAGLFYRAPSEAVLDKRPPVPIPAPHARAFPAPSRELRAPQPSTAPAYKGIPECITLDHELERALAKRAAGASSPSSSAPSPSQSPSLSASSSPITASVVRDDSKHLLHTNAPVETRAPIASRAPIAIASPEVRDDSKYLLHSNAPIVDVIMPSLETRPPIASLKEETSPIAPSPSLLSPLTSSEVRDDPKHLLRISAPIEEPPAASEAQVTPRVNQSLPLVIQSVANDHAHVALFASSDYRAPVKHPCITLHNHQAEHVSGDPGATQAHHIAPEDAQCARLEVLYIYPRLISHFLSLSCLKLLRSYMTLPNTLISSSHYPLFTRHVYAHRAIRARVPAPCAFIILAEFPHHRISIISPLLNHISFTQHKTYSNQSSRRDLGARLTHTYVPKPPIITFNFALTTFIRILRTFAYHVNFVPARLDAHYSPSPMRLLRLDIPPLQPIGATFAPNSSLYTFLANPFAGKWPFLACSANIIKFARNRTKARTSRASYQLVGRLYTPHSASHWRAFNLQRVVQEFILPVTSPPKRASLAHSNPTLSKASARKRREAR